MTMLCVDLAFAAAITACLYRLFCLIGDLYETI